MRKHAAFCLLPLLIALLFQSSPVRAADKLTVMLDWFVNPDHAPLVVAREQGFFAEAGLDVELIAPADPNDPPKLVAAEKIDLAISYQPQLHLQVAQDLPLVRVGTLVATPLNSLVVLKDGPIASLADLKGRKIGFSVGGFEDAILGAMLAKQGLSLTDVTLVNVNFSLSPAILSGQVDAVIGAYRNFELNQMDLLGKPGRAFYPEENGVPAYDELIVVAHRDHLDDKRLRPFLDALERAVLFMVNHPDESWKSFVGAYPALDDELNRRAWRDTLPRFALRPAALDRTRYARFAAFLQERGLIEEILPVAAYAVQVASPSEPELSQGRKSPAARCRAMRL
jgi:putative hydroxymethylpyrimidine transport system substrate-binding protein